MKTLKLFLKVMVLVCSNCQIRKSHPRNPSTHIHVCLYNPLNHHQCPLFQRERCNFKQRSRLIVFIVWFYFSATTHKSMEQDPCTVICFLHGIAFPFSWSGESSWLLSSPCFQRPPPVFVSQSTWWGSAALVLFFRRLIYTLPLGSTEEPPSACPVLWCLGKPYKTQIVAGCGQLKLLT